MTKAEAKKLGSEAAKSRAEWIYTDTDYHRLAEVLQKYRKPGPWREQAASATTEGRSVPAELISNFRAGYASTGPREIEKYIREAKSEGLLKEIKRTVRGL